jgi:hypothetical protein
VFQQAGPPRGRVGPWASGQAHRVRLGIDGLRLEGVSGAGKLVVPVAFVVRRPDPGGPGRPGRAPLTGRQVRRDRPWAVLQRRCRRLPAPLVVAARGLGDSALLAHLPMHQPATGVVAGKRRDVFVRPAGRRVKGQALVTQPDWPWRDRLQGPGRRDARVTATSATDGRVTRVLVDQPGAARVSWWCRETPLSAPRLIRAWHRRRGMEPTFRTLTHLLAAEACPAPTADADDGHLGWRLWAGRVRLSTGRFRWKGRVTMAVIVFSLTHHGRFLTSASLE